MDYQKEAARTAATKFYGQHIQITRLMDNLKKSAEAANCLDDIKKSIFYGKGINDSLAPLNSEESIAGSFITHDQRDLLHGIIGIITEAGEIAENILDHKGDKNLREELGDVMWYIALICNALDITIDDICATNISKLKIRFPDKFTEDKAMNRDLKAEAVALNQPNHEGVSNNDS